MSEAGGDGRWAVWRIDDNGNTFVVREHLTRVEADRVVGEFEARGHKQMYWAERTRDPAVDFHIRPATADDLPAVRAIYNHYVSSSTCTFQIEPDTAEGLHTIIGGACTEQPASLALQEGLGFVRVACFREVVYEFGRRLDAAYTQLMLAPGTEGSRCGT